MWLLEDWKKIFNLLKVYDKSLYSEEILDYMFHPTKFDLLDDHVKAIVIEEYNKIALNSKLGKSTITTSLSDFALSNTMFEKTIDQISFNDSDWNMLREFIIKWYTSFKTMVSMQKHISDLYGMPDTHLDEAFRSKGFLFSTQLSNYGIDINYNKVNFYYDLVNLYKQKGSPRTLLTTLTYFGFPNIELLEYFTYVRRSTQAVEFHSSSSDYTGKWYSTKTDIIPYDEVTSWDPHYLTTEKSIVYGQKKRGLHLPTKSPYFSLRHFINLNDYVKLMTFISRRVQDQYQAWADSILKTVVMPPKELYIESCTMDASVLELYLACIHTYYRHYGTEVEIKHPTNPIWDTTSTLGNHGKDFLCYDGTDASYLTIISDFEDYIESGQQQFVSCKDVSSTIECHDELGLTRDELKANQEHYMDLFSRLTSTNFLQNETIAGKVLKILNPELFERINDLYDIKPETIILGDLLEDLMKWVSSYASIALPHLNFVLFGTSEFKRIMSSLISFFKPYHARLLAYDMAFVVDDKNSESVIVDDSPEDHIIETVHDWDTCNSKPCCNDTCSEPTPDSFYSRDTYDCGSFYDIGGACDGRENAFSIDIEDHLPEPLNCLQGFTVLANYENPAHPDYQKDAYVESTHTGGIIDASTPIDDLPLYYEAQSGNMMDFDEGGCFDGQYGSDVCMIQIID